MSFLGSVFDVVYVWLYPPKEKDLDLSKFGINAFFNCTNLGSMLNQAKILKSLHIDHVRILFNWDST